MGLVITNGRVRKGGVKAPGEKLFALGLRQYFQGSHEKQEAAGGGPARTEHLSISNKTCPGRSLSTPGLVAMLLPSKPKEGRQSH